MKRLLLSKGWTVRRPGGAPVGESALETTGAPASLALLPERDAIAADRRDLVLSVSSPGLPDAVSRIRAFGAP